MNLVSRFLPSLAPGLSAFLNPWVLLIAIAIGAAGFTAGLKVEGWRWDASLTAIAQANVAYIQGFHRRQAKINGAISAELAATRERSEQDRRDFEERLQHAKDDSAQGTIFTVSQDPAPPGGAPRAGEPVVQGIKLAANRLRVTCDAWCVSLWHDGLAQGLPAAYGEWRDDAAAGAPDSVDEADLIRNAGENFRLANQFRAQLLGWQRKACAEGWATNEQCRGVMP